jgi:DNA-binding Lrp family transcriptional regulator
MELDQIDKEILIQYLSDARLSYREIAKRINVAVGTVRSRTNKMEEEGVIRGYSVILDDEQLGYQLTVISEVTVSKGKLVEVEQEIAKFGSVCVVYDVTGVTDVLIIGKFKGRRDLSRFTKTLLSLPYVERTNTRLVLNTIKEDFRNLP